MERGITNRKDILLLLLYSPGLGNSVNEPVAGRTRVIKALFLFKNEAMRHFAKNTTVNSENFYEFFPWNFGPFSRDVYDDLTFLSLRSLVEQFRATEAETTTESLAEWEEYVGEGEFSYIDQSPEEFEEVAYRLTDKGLQYVERELYSRLSPQQRGLLREFKKKIQSPLRAILRYVYTTYPDYTEASQIKDKVLG